MKTSDNILCALTAVLLSASAFIVSAQSVPSLLPPPVGTGYGNVNFTGAASTRPVKVNSGVPATCMEGELIIDRTGTAGNNLYYCSPKKTFVPLGAPTVQLLDPVTQTTSVIGARNTLTFAAGTGIALEVSDTGKSILVQIDPDTSKIQTLVGAQSSGTTFCAATSANSANYTCALMPTLTTYTAGMEIVLQPDVNCAGGPTTLTVDGLATIPVKLADGSSDPDPENCPTDSILVLRMDAHNVFRIMSAPVYPNPVVAQLKKEKSADGTVYDWVKNEIAVGHSILAIGTVCCSQATTPPPAWQANTNEAVGAEILDPAGHVQMAVKAGTTGATPPTFIDSCDAGPCQTPTSPDGTTEWADLGTIPANPVLFNMIAAQ